MPKWIPYSDTELAFLRNHETTPRRELTGLFNCKFNRDISIINITSKCKQMGLKTGRNSCFKKGNVPANKGTKGISGIHPNCRKTQFKKGQAPPNVHGLGHERADKAGYIWLCIDEVNPHTGRPRRYVMKQRHIWQQANGLIPKGSVIKFIDGDRANCSLGNLRLITQAQNAILNKSGLGTITGEPLESALLIVKVKQAGQKRIKALNGER